MDLQSEGITPRPPWLELLGPLPADVRPHRRPLAVPDGRDAAARTPIDGWENLVLELSGGAAGSRILLVLLDDNGKLLSASDHAVYAVERLNSESAILRQVSIGGRFEDDGTFRGTCWHMVAPEPIGDQDPEWEMTRSEPDPAQVARLRILVAEVLRRMPKPHR